MTQDNDEWGNIELPGLSDKELYGKNWNTALTEAEKEHRRKINKANMSNPVYRKQWDVAQKAGVKKAWDSEAGKKRKETLGKKISKFRKENPREYTEEERTQRRETTKNLHQDPEFRKKYEEGLSKRNYHTDAAIKGRKKAGETRRKIIVTPHGEIATLAAMSAFYNINVGSCQSRMKDKPHLYYYKDDGPGKPTYAEVVYTPDGRFKSQREAMKAYTGDLPKNQGWWKKVIKLYPDEYYIKLEIKEDY